MPLIGNPVRQRIVNQAWWGIAHTAQISYGQIRPVPLERWKARELPIKTDCSGFATCCYFAAGAPDPNGDGYDTSKPMFTGTMLANLKVIQQAALHPGDLVVFGGGDGEHVAVILECDGADPLLASHGSDIGPIEIRLSVERTFHAGQPVTFLQGVPKMSRIRKKRLHVVADNQIVSAASGVKRWVLRHPAKSKQFGDELTFRRVKAHAASAGTTNKSTHPKQ